MRSIENSGIVVSSFYGLVSIPDPEEFAARLRSIGQGLRGLNIVAREGFNGTISGPPEAVDRFKSELFALAGASIAFKDCPAVAHPYGKYQVKVRDEVITSGFELSIPVGGVGNRLSLEEWDRAMREEDVQILDTRNTYETGIGKFRGAIDPGIGAFSEFRSFLETSGLDPNKKTLIYCTGGIRCEKAVLEMERRGFQDVHQLEGGILAYLARFRGGLFEGECFVFDDRVAVTSELEPTSRYRFCANCGQPAEGGAEEEGAPSSVGQMCGDCCDSSERS